MDKKEIFKELRMEEIDGLGISTSYSQYDKFIPIEEVYKTIDEIFEYIEKESKKWN